MHEGKELDQVKSSKVCQAETARLGRSMAKIGWFGRHPAGGLGQLQCFDFAVLAHPDRGGEAGHDSGRGRQENTPRAGAVI
jgi:hypothetical protein